MCFAGSRIWSVYLLESGRKQVGMSVVNISSLELASRLCLQLPQSRLGSQAPFPVDAAAPSMTHMFWSQEVTWVLLSHTVGRELFCATRGSKGRGVIVFAVNTWPMES